MRRLRVRVTPGSARGPRVDPAPEGSGVDLLVVVRERAVDGRANAAVERALAAHLGLAPSRVSVVRGHTARIKLVAVED